MSLGCTKSEVYREKENFPFALKHWSILAQRIMFSSIYGTLLHLFTTIHSCAVFLHPDIQGAEHFHIGHIGEKKDEKVSNYPRP